MHAADTTTRSRFGQWVDTLSYRKAVALNVVVHLNAMLLILVVMMLVGGGPWPTSSGNGLPAGTMIQQGRVVIGQTPVEGFNEGAVLDPSQVERR